MTVKELINRLEDMPQDYPVVSENIEITEVLIRDEIYTTEGGWYEEGPAVKLN